MQALAWWRWTDGALARSRGAWLWLGQAALAILGLHLACNTLDDLLLDALVALPVATVEAADAAPVAMGLAVTLELGAAAWVVARLWLALARPPATWDGWRRRLDVGRVARPVLWVPLVLSGAWVIAMAIEDVLAPIDPTLGWVVGWLAAGLAVWRLGWPGLRAMAARGLGRGRLAGWPDLLLLPVVALAVSALPVWGWL